MANHMEEVAKMFGLELEEHFHITKKSYENTVYKFTKDGVVFYDNKLRTWYESVGALAGILTGETEVVKLPWKPREGDRYYFPCPATIEKWDYSTWSEREVDYYRLNHGFACKTMERAVAISQEMLKDIRVIEEE